MMMATATFDTDLTTFQNQTYLAQDQGAGFQFFQWQHSEPE